MSTCEIRLGRCVTHNQPPSYDDATYCDVGFNDGWVDMMSDDQHRDARDGDIRNAIGDLKRSLAWQCARIRQPTDEDRRAHDAIGKAIQMLAALPTRVRAKPKRRRSRP